MEIKKQLLAMVNISIHPKQTLINLPADKFYIVGFLISIYFSMGNISRDGDIARLAIGLNSKMAAYVIYFFFCAIIFVVTSLIFKLLVRIFGKPLSLNKVMNIIGYSQTPRLILSLPASILLAMLPKGTRLELFSSMNEGGIATTISIVFSILGMLLFFYTIFLLIWGFILSKES